MVGKATKKGAEKAAKKKAKKEATDPVSVEATLAPVLDSRPEKIVAFDVQDAGNLVPVWKVPNPEQVGKQHIFGPPIPPEEYEKFKKVLDSVREELSELPGVCGVSGGLQYKNEYSTGQLAIRLIAANDKDKRALKKYASALGLKPCYGDGENMYPLDIIVRNIKLAAAEGDPIREPIRDKSGTLGAVVTRKIIASPRTGWITAAHVVSNRRVTDVPPHPSTNVTILDDANQPFGEVRADPRFYRYSPAVDCALVLPLAGDPPPTPPTGQQLSSGNLAVNQHVTMKKRDGGTSHGTVESVDTDPQSADDDGFPVAMIDQFNVLGFDPNNMANKVPFAIQGDSGSVLKEDQNPLTIVGMLRAVDVSRKIGIATKMHNITTALDIK